jgi:hypothetical protein
VGGTNPVQTATLTFTANGTVASINVLTKGAPNLDFQYASGGTCTVGTAYTTGQTCTVKYAFSPLAAGTRYGAVALYNSASSASSIATTFLQAVGNGPQLAFLPNTLSALDAALSRAPGATALAIDGSGNLFLADSKHKWIFETFAESGYTTIETLTSTINNYPLGVALDGGGNLFFAASDKGTLKELTAASGYTNVITLATVPPYVEKLTVDGNGNVFFCDAAVINGTPESSVMELAAAEG